MALCEGVCTDLQTSALHCGACGNQCSAATCIDGVCQSCAPGICPASVNGAEGGGNGITSSAGATQGGGGGTAGSGTGGASSGATGAGGGGGTASYGGYITSGAWHGYAWTAATPGEGEIDPSDFADVTNFPLCASGTVAAGENNVAMVGWNINQPAEGGDAATVIPTLDGIFVSVSNPGGSALRLQLQGPNAEVDPDERWCAPIENGGGFIPFRAFNTQCWSDAGNGYDGESIVAVAVMVPGIEGRAVSFDFCVAELGEAEGTASPPSTGGAYGSGGAGTGGDPSTGGSGGGASGGSRGAAVPPIDNGCNGYATRFWDCCKPHCGWSGNVPDSMSPMTSCSPSGASLGNNYDVQSSCNGGGAYACYGLSPWAVSSDLSYGYAATSSGDVCGRCYQLEFSGYSYNAGADPGSQALSGKTMIVQAINVGYDVQGGQFDLLIPGGGVGAHDGCSNQWNVLPNELGEPYGGFLATCAQSGGSYSENVQCVRQRCSSVFSSRGLDELAAGCIWFVDWFAAADNPALIYKEVECPQVLIDKSGMDRRPLDDVAGSCGG